MAKTAEVTRHLLPGHAAPWSIDAPADPADATTDARAPWRDLATVAQQMAVQDVEPRERWRMARMAGFSPVESATIAKIAKLGTWGKFLEAVQAASYFDVQV